MFSKKLIAIIILIKKHKTIPSANELCRLAETEKVCTRKTVFNLLPQIKDSESVNFEVIDRQITFSYVDVSKKKYFMNNELDKIDSMINDEEKVLNAIKSASRRQLTEKTKRNFGSLSIGSRRKIVRLQQKMVYFESLGHNKGTIKDRFKRTKIKLAELNLYIQKAINKLDSKISALVFVQIDSEYYPQYPHD